VTHVLVEHIKTKLGLNHASRVLLAKGTSCQANRAKQHAKLALPEKHPGRGQLVLSAAGSAIKATIHRHQGWSHAHHAHRAPSKTLPELQLAMPAQLVRHMIQRLLLAPPPALYAALANMLLDSWICTQGRQVANHAPSVNILQSSAVRIVLYVMSGLFRIQQWLAPVFPVPLVDMLLPMAFQAAYKEPALLGRSYQTCL